MAQPTTNPGPAAETASFGKVAIKMGFISQAQLDEAMKAQSTAAKAGLRKRLGEILIKKGYLSPEQFQKVLKAQVVKAKRIGDYELISKLGEGGMGAVFKARQVYMDRVIALKILSPKMAKNKDFCERFIREARAVAKLNHPHIVAGIDVGKKDGYFYFAMEFVDGESLGQYMQRKGGKLDEASALEFVRQTAMALQHAHQNNLLHRDVKPDNVLLDSDHHTVKLADLGLARSAESHDDDLALTQAGQAVGTPFYISPEQARGSSDLTPATDLYSLGATLFHLLTGQVPFDGPTAAVIMTRHLTDPVPSVCRVAPHVSSAADKIVTKCMQKNPEDRYQNAMDLVEDIERVQEGVGVVLVDRGRGARQAAPPERSREREKEREPERPRERERAREKEREPVREREPAREAREPREPKERPESAVSGSLPQTRLRRRRQSNDMFSLLMGAMFIGVIVVMFYYFSPSTPKPPVKRPPTPGTQQQPAPPSSTAAPVLPEQPPAPSVAVDARPSAVPVPLQPGPDGKISFKADFQGKIPNFDVDPLLSRADDNINTYSDGTTNFVLRLARVRDKDSGAMARLLLPADLQWSGRATLSFLVRFSDQYKDTNPEIQILWDHHRDGGQARFVSKWIIKDPALKASWKPVKVQLDSAPIRLPSRQLPEKPQFIAIMAGKPDEVLDVFIDELELSDGPAEEPKKFREGPIAPAKQDPPAATPKEAPIAPPKKATPDDAVNKAL